MPLDLVRGRIQGQEFIQKKPRTLKAPDIAGAPTQHFMRIQLVKTQDGQLQSKLPS